MELELRINGVVKSLDVAANESLLTVLRHEGYVSVKHGCETGECGACTVLVDSMPRPSCVMLASQAGGCTLMTAEALGGRRAYVVAERSGADIASGVGSAQKLHPLQEAFADTGAIQCGFCTPGMLLSAYALLRYNPHPSEDEVRDALSGNLCRCTGYVKPVQAVMRAAAVMRGETKQGVVATRSLGATSTLVGASDVTDVTPSDLRVVGKPERKVDVLKLVTGKPAFVDDIELREMLHGRLLTSPHAHAVIRNIDVTQARALPGVHAVLTYKDVQRVPHTTATQSSSESGPHDQYCLDYTVRFVGDRVAAVAADTSEIAEQALSLIQVEYEVLPAVLDPRQAIEPNAPRLHAEADAHGIYNASRNIAARIQAEVGDVDRGFAASDLVVEGEYILPQVQQTPIENHVVITYWDADERLVVRTNTEAPHQVRRMLAPILGLPPRRIRIVKPRIGGSFGAKQDVVLEDICALLTLATRRPVRLELTRAEEFYSGGSRHAQIVQMKTGVKRDGTLMANQMVLLANTGAYGMHALTVQQNTGVQSLPLYACPNMRFVAQAVYTNLPPAGVFCGYGAPQGFFALESQMDEVAKRLGIDALELRRKNWLTVGNKNLLAEAFANAGGTDQSKESHTQIIASCGLLQCLQIVEEKLSWKEKRGRGATGRFRRGVGVALTMYSPASLATELSGASIKLNDDGSCNVLVGSTDSGTGSDTILAQIAAEVVGVPLEDIIIHSSGVVDTDLAPFGTAESVYASGDAVRRAAEWVRQQILAVAGSMLDARPETLTINAGLITALDGQTVTVAQVAQYTLYSEGQQIIATASSTNSQQPPAFAAQGAEVEVDSETGVVRVLKAISAVDAGCIINPLIAEGQIEGSVTQSLGYALCEEMLYDQRGTLLTANFSDYRIYNAPDMPPLETYIVETSDPAGPFAAKAIAEVAIAGMAPAVANAVADALELRIHQLPLTTERVLRAIHVAARGTSP